MKRNHNRNRVIAAVGARMSPNFVLAARAFQYAQAAKRDERNCLPYTAAMEWRKAVEILTPTTWAAEYCWRQWERIMKLPRRLAAPIGVHPTLAFPVKSASATRPSLTPAMDESTLATAA